MFKNKYPFLDTDSNNGSFLGVLIEKGKKDTHYHLTFVKFP